jgi:cation diffusion facilitator CzcD-associated flavoprotein CzcO
MTVFQRHAPYVVPKPDVEYPDRHRRLVGRFPDLLGTERRSVFRLSELLNSALEGESVLTRTPILQLLEKSWRVQLRTQVKDKVLREKLVPNYPIGCKRILFSNDWYPALDRDHVDVVTEGVTSVEPGGVRDATGRLHEADVLIWGTGFAATDFLGGMQVTGKGGADLGELWSDGAYAHLGIAVPGFPNFFLVYGPNTNLGGSSIIGMLESQSAWIGQVVERIATGPFPALEVRPEVCDAWDTEMQSRLAGSVWTQCDNWYSDGSRVTTNWPGKVSEYQARLRTVDFGELSPA